jgi:para-nitrobenzyl esterase
MLNLFRWMAFSAVLFAVPAWSADSSPAVAVTGGRIQGGVLERGGAVFKGIPFAQPPVEALRWREPQPVKPWTGVRPAMSFGAPCAQNSGNGRVLENSSEDCLYLNVWTPEWPTRTRKPVMFWMHGGGNYAGATGSPNFDGESLARHGVVLVSAAYRLTAFGFFAHPELTRESPHHSSGNYGLLDQIAALQWVRDNIAQFGGDPSSVTVFGQSAGAVDATVLMTSPLAKGLFHKVIAESGTVTRNPDAATFAMTALAPVMAIKNGTVTYSDAPELAEAERNGQELAQMLQAPATESLRYLRALSAADILKAAASPQRSIGPANGIVVDGWVLPRPPAEVFATGHEHRVPLLTGNNARERTPPRTTPEDLTTAMASMYGPLAPRAAALYTKPDPLYGDVGGGHHVSLSGRG